jgi:hypothetical protein
MTRLLIATVLCILSACTDPHQRPLTEDEKAACVLRCEDGCPGPTPPLSCVGSCVTNCDRQTAPR